MPLHPFGMDKKTFHTVFNTIPFPSCLPRRRLCLIPPAYIVVQRFLQPSAATCAYFLLLLLSFVFHTFSFSTYIFPLLFCHTYILASPTNTQCCGTHS